MLEDKALDSNPKSWEVRNKKLYFFKKLPTLEMGIGIHSGHLIAGNIDSQKRMKYGVID